MSEAARQHTHHAAAARPPAPGPLRDWLTAMKAATAQPGEPPRHEPDRQDRMAVQAQPQSWSPRVVAAPPSAAQPQAAAPEADGDVADLMAENMMLKAKLRIESDRYDDLQAILAQELRDLRSHIDAEMEELNEVRAERDLWMARAEALAQPLFQKR